MSKPKLVVMAAGMGSRYGGLKQIAPVDDAGHVIIDFSIYDAIRAGFGGVVFIIKPELEKDFRNTIGARVAAHIPVEYAHQTLDRLPEGFTVPEGRVKPWGTGHAVLCARGCIDGPFAVINADDFYGRTAFSAIHDFLISSGEANEHAMVGYRLCNTLTENGSASVKWEKTVACARLSNARALRRARVAPRSQKTTDAPTTLCPRTR